MTNNVAPNPLARFYYWESTKPNAVFMRQPKTAADGSRTWTEYTWAEAGRQARSVATALQATGLPKGSRISILSINCAHWVMADLAIQMAGYVSAPTFTTMAAEAIKYIVDNADVKAFFVGESSNWEGVQEIIADDIKLISFPDIDLGREQSNWNDLVTDNKPLEGSTPPNLDDLKTIIYTSGTTGLPKGVMLSYFSSGSSIEILSSLLASDENDRFFSYLPLAHGAERNIVEGNCIYCGGQINFNESQATFIPDMIECKPTLLLSVPRIWTKLQQLCTAKANGVDLDSLSEDELAEVARSSRELLGLNELRFALTGTAPTPAAQHAWYEKIGIPLCELYGQSEILSGICSTPTMRKLGYVGKPMPGVDVRITDSGEILLRSKAAMVGYWGEPEKTAEVFTDDGFIKTGDKGEFNDEGFIRITGRVKELFKTAKGKYVAPVPIESKVSHCSYLEQVLIMGSGYPQTMLAVTLSPIGLETDVDLLKQELAELVEEINPEIEHHAQIGAVLIVPEPWTMESGYLTHTMKLKRESIENEYMDLLGSYMGEDWSKVKVVTLPELNKL
jgi:long-chain acyl-CoA synthetase